MDTIADISAAKLDLGWEPQTSLKVGLMDVLKTYSIGKIAEI